ncbi:penicillin-binding protein 1A [Aestuariirhabdus litorea]|uniref:Penicillin-binding protein 1A n=1 Tax=Aestuariirhabdus litorea TaxID=2528527 RepID=A0A3P3VK93_9GAMM|nr:penicillin-binding protein 1A [Aestuariirhabdus litorea]RRJ83151.1 penicillin-binding protein 1A [Aestuariirhabdus litorea]RWW93307.1 PBP1A family penicillin-binding protein [Endozoicomonadaceae bacterium GTF-13]
MKSTLRLARLLCWATFLLICGSVLIFASAYLYLSPGLPTVESLKDVRLQTPLRIYTSDSKLIAEFGEKRRTPLHFQQIPSAMIQAVLSAEDDRFYEHHGVDIRGLLRAAAQLIQSGQIQSGGSTITMQVAKNFFLSNKRVFSRKFNEILLALDIESELTKEQILELYLNKIYLGNRAYGIEAAAQVYYGQPIEQLSLAQLAMIAGLPKAPSRYNPIVNPQRAIIRRNWILGRMLELGHIDQSAHDAAVTEPVTASYHGLQNEVDAPYIAEMVRADLLERYGSDIYTDGYRVITTIDSSLQQAATRATQQGLMEYDRRHGYRGPESQLPLTDDNALEPALDSLKATPAVGPLLPALVIRTEGQQAEVMLRDGVATIPWEGLAWARRYIDVNTLGEKPEQASDVVTRGDLVRVERQADGSYWLAQQPVVQGALVSFRPDDGALLALVGGFNFHSSKFNRATQAEREVGSNIKPFIYSAALENGFTAASIINDAPVVFEDQSLEDTWRPQNDSGRFYGPTRLRTALYNSRNLVSIRLLQEIGIAKARAYVQRFGFDPERLPKDLSLALGSATMPPYDLAAGYMAIANGGYRVIPHFIQRIDLLDETRFEMQPHRVCRSECTPEAETASLSALAAPAPLDTATPLASEAASMEIEQASITPIPAQRIMDERVNYIMTTMLRDVIQSGTGRRARALGRKDIGGKTGTTNDQKDAWFSGFNPEVHTTVWVGFDQPVTLGRREYGGTAALPIWVDYMTQALKETPEQPLAQPEGIITMRINAEDGTPAASGSPGAIFEVFRREFAPVASATPAPRLELEESPGTLPQELF